MSYSISKLGSLDIEHIENCVISEQRDLVATISSDYELKIYNGLSDDQFNLIKQFKNHQGAIISVVFAPEIYHTYLLSIGYDKSLFLYNLDDSKSNDPLFSYTEENEKIGYFTSAIFDQRNKSRLIFYVGTSTGELLTFDSDFSFEPKVNSVSSSMIKSMSTNSNGDLIIASANTTPTIYFESNLDEPIKIEEEGQNLLKVVQVQFNYQIIESTVSLLSIVTEDQMIGIYELNSALQFVKAVQLIELPLNIIAVNWNVSGFSISAFCGKKEEKLDSIKIFKLQNLDSTGGSDFRVKQLENKND